MSKPKVVFVGSFPPIASAMKITGDGSGMRIQIDIPESEMAQAVNLMLYRQVPIKVTIEEYEQEKPKGDETTTGDNAGSNGRRTLKRTTARR